MKNVFLFTICLLIFCNCEDVTEHNIETTVSGVVFDSTSQLPISNYKIKVGEYNKRLVGIMWKPQFIQFLDSTYTNTSGYYSITFKTSGKGDYYQLEYETPVGYTYIEPNYIFFYKELAIGENNERNLFLLKTATLKARIIVHENPSPPLKLYPPLVGNNFITINGFNTDTTVYVQVGRKTSNRFLFTIKKEFVEHHYEYLNVENVALNDTIEHIFEVYPSKFD